MENAPNDVSIIDEEDDGLSIFDRMPQGGFEVQMRGYERSQVEKHIRALESALTQVRSRNRDLDKQIVRLRQELAEKETSLREVEQPSYSGLGARIEHLLRLAEEQASELVGQADAEASEMRAEARVDAQELRAAAENDAAEMRANAKREADELIAEAKSEAESHRSAAQREAGNLVDSAKSEAATIRTAIEHEAAEKRANLERELDRDRS